MIYIPTQKVSFQHALKCGLKFIIKNWPFGGTCPKDQFFWPRRSVCIFFGPKEQFTHKKKGKKLACKISQLPHFRSTLMFFFFRFWLKYYKWTSWTLHGIRYTYLKVIFNSIATSLEGCYPTSRIAWRGGLAWLVSERE